MRSRARSSTPPTSIRSRRSPRCPSSPRSRRRSARACRPLAASPCRARRSRPRQAGQSTLPSSTSRRTRIGRSARQGRPSPMSRLAAPTGSRSIPSARRGCTASRKADGRPATTSTSRASTLPFGANLIDPIDEAWDSAEIVVLVIDPWSVHWDTQTTATPRTQLAPELDRPARLPLVRARAVERERRRTRRRAAEERDRRRPSRGTFAVPRRPGAEIRCSIATGSRARLKQALAEVLPRLKEEIRKRPRCRCRFQAVRQGRDAVGATSGP